METISYRLKEGALPVTVSLVGSALSDNVHTSYGDYSFTDVPYGEYSLQITDANDCIKNISLVYCKSCPGGWTATIEGCYTEETVAATPPTDAKTIVAKTNLNYTNFGVALFGEGWNYDGTGDTYTLYHETVSNFWGNYSGNTTDGAMNRCGVWSATEVSSQMVGFSTCVDIASTKSYYIGIGCDNYAEIRIDGVSVLYQDEVALNIWAPASPAGDAICFKYFYIYPITLSAGRHVMEVIGHNNSLVAAVGAEIYDMTEADLMACTSYVDLGTHLIFSSKDKVGDPVDIGDNGQGYTCPDGYALGFCDGPPSCYKFTYVNCGDPAPTTITTTTVEE